MTSTHVIVLAAGVGSRLQAAGNTMPKWLVPVGGRPVADRQMNALAMSPSVRAGSVTVVTGAGSAAVLAYLQSARLAVSTVHNPQFATLNNWYSLLVGLRTLPPLEAGARCMVLNSDLLARPSWYLSYLESPLPPTGASIAVDKVKTLTQESMKVSPTEDGLYLKAIGKVAVPEPVGEYVGMLMFDQRHRELLERTMATFEVEPNRANEWYEGAVRETAARSGRWSIWPTLSSDWIEIDDAADLLVAEELVRRW